MKKGILSAFLLFAVIVSTIKAQTPMLWGLATQNTVNLGNQPAGMYFVYMQTAEGMLNARVVVER